MALFKHKAIETVEEAHRRAKKILPRDVYTALMAGSDSGATMKGNLAAFEEIGLIPRVGVELPSKLDMKTSFMGQPIDLPVVIAPAAAQAMHPDAELGVARAAQRAGTAISLSNFASMPFEDVAQANGNAFAHVYLSGDRDTIAGRVERFRKAGAKGLIFTLDVSGGRIANQPRDWGSPVYPDGLDLAAMIRYSPMALGNPLWFMRYLRRGSIPGLDAPNMSKADGIVPTLVGGLYEWVASPIPTWDDVAWLRELWGGPFMVKGILTPDDARRAVDAGATAIGVSNHGGNNLDTTPSPLRFLPGVVKAVGNQVEVTFDSGIRRGADVVKALALGAQSVMIGRPWFYGLAADGERGVYEVLESFRISIERTLVGLGKSSINDLSADDLVIPPDYFLNLAVSTGAGIVRGDAAA